MAFQRHLENYHITGPKIDFGGIEWHVPSDDTLKSADLVVAEHVKRDDVLALLKKAGSSARVVKKDELLEIATRQNRPWQSVVLQMLAEK